MPRHNIALQRLYVIPASLEYINPTGSVRDCLDASHTMFWPSDQTYDNSLDIFRN